jgi:mitochondrial fission protein ELM1
MAEKSRTQLPKVSFFWMFRNLDFESEDFQEEFTRKIFSSSRRQSPIAVGLQERFGDIQAIQVRPPMVRQQTFKVTELTEYGDCFHQDMTAACEKLKGAATTTNTALSTGEGVLAC